MRPELLYICCIFPDCSFSFQFHFCSLVAPIFKPGSKELDTKRVNPQGELIEVQSIVNINGTFYHYGFLVTKLIIILY